MGRCHVSRLWKEGSRPSSAMEAEPRACPRCTLVQSHARPRCEICDAQLPKLPAPPPSHATKRKPPATAGSKEKAAKADSIATFFRPNAASPSAAAASPSAAAACSSSPVQSIPSQQPSELVEPLASYAPHAAGWPTGARVPYAHVAAALDAVSGTRSRLTKELVLTNAFRAALALGAPAPELE